MYDLTVYCLVPEYVNYLSTRCNCDASDPVAFFGWLSKANALYLADPYRYDLTSQYMDILYNSKIVFADPVNLTELAHIHNNSHLDYEIRTVIDVHQKLFENISGNSR